MRPPSRTRPSPGLDRTRGWSTCRCFSFTSGPTGSSNLERSSCAVQIPAGLPSPDAASSALQIGREPLPVPTGSDAAAVTCRRSREQSGLSFRLLRLLSPCPARPSRSRRRKKTGNRLRLGFCVAMTLLSCFPASRPLCWTFHRETKHFYLTILRAASGLCLQRPPSPCGSPPSRPRWARSDQNGVQHGHNWHLYEIW
jgi:hypothetical protein